MAAVLDAVEKQCVVVLMSALCYFKTGLILGLFLPTFLLLNATVASGSLGTARTELPTAHSCRPTLTHWCLLAVEQLAHSVLFPQVMKTYHMYHAESISAESKLKEAEKQEEKQFNKSGDVSVNLLRHEERPQRRSSVKKIEKMKEKVGVWGEEPGWSPGLSGAACAAGA